MLCFLYNINYNAIAYCIIMLYMFEYVEICVFYEKFLWFSGYIGVEKY